MCANILHDRRSIRLKGYDYSSSGAYYITICTENRFHFFGKITDRQMILNHNGICVQQCWDDIPKHYPNVELDTFVIMPNHIHGIIIIKNPKTVVEANNHSPKLVGAKNFSPQQTTHSPQQTIHSTQQRPRGTSKTIGAIIRGFKIGVTKLLREKYKGDIWQRNYWEHIVRTEEDLNRIRKYIINNPINWKGDRFHRIP